MKVLRKTQKLLALLTILTFVVGIAAVGAPKAAYAKTEDTSLAKKASIVQKLVSDITDKDEKDAVLRLNAFGIIDGMEDGKYHPELNVTREQFAKILVTSLKMDSAAQAGMGHASFKDVEANRWSAGYISVAAGQGLIKGYPDGTFKPAKEVTYAEAATMLVRALGYKDDFLHGQWPGNYLAKAAEKDITKKVKFSEAAGSANRGDVAVMVNNTLDAEIVKVETYEGNVIKYKEEEITLLEDKLKIEKIEDARVIANKRLDDGLDEAEVTVRIKGEKKDDYDEKDYDLDEVVSPERFMGEEVTIYLNDDDEIVYIEREDDDKAYFDFVEEVAVRDKVVEKLSLVKADDDFEFDKDAVIHILQNKKYKTVAYDKLGANDVLGKVGKFVIKNRKIVFAEIMESDETEPWFIVMKNDNGLLTGICEDDDDFDIDLRKGEDYDGVIILDIDGNEMSIGDIQKGNLIYAQKQEYDGDDYAIVRVVKDNIVEGKLHSVKSDKLKIDKEEIKVVKYTEDNDLVVRAYYSIDAGDEIKQYLLKNDDVSSDMEDADEEDIIAYTDVVGRIAYFITEAKASSGYKYGVVTRIYADRDRVKIFTIDNKGEGDEIVYRVEEEDNLDEGGALALNEYGQKKDNAGPATVYEGSIVKFKLNSSGEIAEDKLYVMDPKSVWRIDPGNDFGKDFLPKAQRFKDYKADSSDRAGAKISPVGTAAETFTFSVDDNVVVIDAETYEFVSKQANKDRLELKAGLFADYDSGEFSEANWEDLKEANGIDGYFYVLCDDDRKVDAKAVIFIGNGSGAASDDEMAIYVIDAWKKGGDVQVEYHPFDGSVQKRVLDDDGDSYYKKYNDEFPYIAKVKSNGKLAIAKPGDPKHDFDIYYGKVAKRDASSLEMEWVGRLTDKTVVDGKTFSISNKTVVYEEDSKKSTSNIRRNDTIVFVVENGTKVRVVKRLTDDEAKAYTEPKAKTESKPEPEKEETQETENTAPEADNTGADTTGADTTEPAAAPENDSTSGDGQVVEEEPTPENPEGVVEGDTPDVQPAE